MGYIDIVDREDISSIMERTLSAFYQCEVTFENRYSPNSFILNPRLNCAIVRGTRKEVKKFIQKGHAVHKNSLKKYLMKIFILLAFSTKGMFGCKYIRFSKMPAYSKALLIMPGNMKIKIFNFQNKTITNLLKNGFDYGPLETEKKVRNNNAASYILPLIDKSKNLYEERFETGCTLDRLNPKLYKEVEAKIYTILSDIQSNNRIQKQAKEYCIKLKTQIENCLSHIKVTNDELASIRIFMNQMIKSANGIVTISDSHGDFQNGNIFVSDSLDVYILDWETFGTRSIGYDILTFFYKFRYRKDFLSRIDTFLRDGNWINISMRYWGHEVNKEDVLVVFFLEDILWLVQECYSTPERKATGTLLLYSNEDFQKAIQKRINKI